MPSGCDEHLLLPKSERYGFHAAIEARVDGAVYLVTHLFIPPEKKRKSNTSLT